MGKTYYYLLEIGSLVIELDGIPGFDL